MTAQPQTVMDIVNAACHMSDNDLAEYVRSNLPGLSALNIDVTTIMDGPTTLTDGLIIGTRAMSYEGFINVLGRLAVANKLDWTAVNNFHSANRVNLGLLFSIRIVAGEPMTPMMMESLPGINGG